MDFITFQPVKMHRQILTSLVPSQMGKTVVIVDNTSHKIRGRFGLWDVPGWINGLVHDCWVTAKIRSLPEVKLPIFGEFETPTDKLQKTLLYEWGTARLELELLLGDGLGNWGSFGESAVKNSNGYKYRKHRALDLMTDNPGFFLEESFKIAVRLINVGFGDLTASDKIDVMGAWTQEFIAIQQQPPYVVNNVYGSTAAPTPPPTSQAVLTLTLPSGTSARIASGTLIAVTLSKASANRSYTGTWRKDGTSTVLTSTLATNTTGDASLNFDSSAFATLGAGKYSLEITDNNIKVISNEVNAVLPTLGITPTTAYNSSSSTISVSVAGININDTYTLQFPGVSNTSAVRTQTAETTTFTFSGSLFATPGTYRARLTKGNVTVDSPDLIIIPAPTVTLSTPRANIGFFAEDTAITFRAANLQPSATFTFSWIKNGVAVATANNTSNASGVWEGVLGCSALANAPYGEGIYQLRVTQGTIEATSNNLDVRAFKFNFQPVATQIFYAASNQNIGFQILGLPQGVNFTYTVLKGGVVQGSPVTLTCTYATSTQFCAVNINAATIFNAYGAANNYSVRFSYNNQTLTSNTFSVQQQDNTNYSGGLG